MKKHLTLLVLTLIALVQFFDRALMVVILEPLKQEFSLSDSQLGLLSGFSYAAAFALHGFDKVFARAPEADDCGV